MRIARACLAASALAAAGGCLNDNGAVRLDLSRAVGVAPALAGYSASNAAVAVDPNGFFHFTATSSQGTLTMRLSGPLAEGQTIDLASGQDVVELAVGDATWGDDGGALVVESRKPLIIGFSGVPMSARTPAAHGSFVVDGTGTFR